MTDKLVVLTTCGSEEEAERLARMLVEERLAACVAVTPRVRSYSQWQGRLEESEEWALTAKTSRAATRPRSSSPSALSTSRTD